MKPAETPIVYVIDDDPGIRKSVKMLFDSADLVSQMFESAAEFLDVVNVKAPSCLVLDLRMPVMGGPELLQKLRDMQYEMPVVIISGHADVPITVRMMKLGAVEVLEKPFEPQALLSIVRRSLQSAMDIAQNASDHAHVIERMSALTPRELELLKLVVAGKANKEIAKDLGISIKTVANHRASLMAKTQALNAADLSRLSVVAGIVPAK